MEKIMEATPDKSWLFLFLLMFGAIAVGVVGVAGVAVVSAIAPGYYSLPLAPCATEIPVENNIKTGEASGYTYFYIFGDASEATILNACRNGAIKKIATVDYSMHNHMSIWQKWTCTVSGYRADQVEKAVEATPAVMDEG